MIYLDNAATTFPKPSCVIKEVVKCLRDYCGNPGRSGHRLSLVSAEKIYSAREKISELLNISSAEKIVFTQNATHALNLAIKTSINEKCHIITSDIEHNSVLRPLYSLESSLGCEISYFNSNLPLEDAIPPLLRKDTRFIISTLASNVTGRSISISDLSRIAKTYSLGVIVDSSQYIGHQDIDLSLHPVSILCAPGHKSLFGIQGVGFAAILDDIPRKTIVEGGSGIDSFERYMPQNLPERFEAGTLSTPAIVSLLSGLEFIERVTLEAINQKINKLTKMMQDMLDIKGVEILGCENGICAFNIKGLKSELAANLLSDKGIAVRGGYHCAPTCHKKLGTQNIGAIRASLSYLNSPKDIERLRRSVIEIISQ